MVRTLKDASEFGLLLWLDEHPGHGRAYCRSEVVYLAVRVDVGKRRVESCFLEVGNAYIFEPYFFKKLVSGWTQFRVLV